MTPVRLGRLWCSASLFITYINIKICSTPPRWRLLGPQSLPTHWKPVVRDIPPAVPSFLPNIKVSISFLLLFHTWLKVVTVSSSSNLRGQNSSEISLYFPVSWFPNMDKEWACGISLREEGIPTGWAAISPVTPPPPLRFHWTNLQSMGFEKPSVSEACPQKGSPRFLVWRVGVPSLPANCCLVCLSGSTWIQPKVLHADWTFCTLLCLDTKLFLFLWESSTSMFTQFLFLH